MKILKIVLSFIALIAAALGVAQASGAIKWAPALVDLIMAGGTVLGTFGIVPLTLTIAEHRACAGIATFAAAVVTAHATGTIPGAPKVFNVVAVGAALLSILGRWDDPNAPVPAAPTPPAPVPPKAA
jgi:hypothetical protein